MPNNEWLRQLEELAPSPNKKFSYDWLNAEKALRTGLPRDYKDLIESYGPGVFAGYISVYTPNNNNDAMDLISRTRAARASLDYLINRQEELPFGIKSVETFMPWGVADNGEWCYWIREGNPDSWDIALNADREAEWEKFDMGISEFLLKVISRAMVVGIFPEEFPSDDVSFSSAT